MLKKILRKLLRWLRENSAKEDTPPTLTKNKTTPFGQAIYIPRWRLKNYYAVNEFGPDVARWFCEQRYTYMLGEFPDLDNPKTFNEKIYWLNLYYQNPLITTCCDKYKLKDYVTETIGAEHTVPTVKVYHKANDINLDELPDRFAIKVNWGDGTEFSELVKNKKDVNIHELKAKMSNCMAPWNNLYYSHFFWGYKNVEPVIMVEEFIGYGEDDLIDYKVHCFQGKARIILVCENRFGKTGIKKTFLDPEWNLLPFYREDAPINHRVKKPANLKKMIDLAEKLAAPFPFVRVDFYNFQGKILVGEMTFNPGLGFEKFYPEEWNIRVGDMLELPEKLIADI